MLSFLQNFGKKRPTPQAAMTRSDSMDSALLGSTIGSSSKGDKDSTPATSTADTASIAFDTTPKAKGRGDGSRSLRASRSNISTYNESVLSGSAKHGYRKKGVDTSSRAVSGETLVEGKGNSPIDFVEKSTQNLDTSWSLGFLPGDSICMSTRTEEGIKKRRSTRLSVLAFASSVMEQTRSVLGKRGREDQDMEPTKMPSVKQEPASGGIPNGAAAPSFEGPQSKRLRLESNPHDGFSDSTAQKPRESTKRPLKRWLTQGLYVGQDPDFDPRFTTAKNKLKKARAKTDPLKTRSILPLPMFAGQRVLETGRNFKLPFDVFSPLPAGQPKPDEWKKTHKNVFIGDAAAVWRKSRLEPSRCVCTPDKGCDHSCLNRHMFYECDDTNCNVGADHCNNRSFEGLKQRHKKGGKYNIGVEVIKTADRGYGVRSNRTFEPHQIIVEYTGEIITQDECDERMENRYKDNECFYLMEFDQKMILDATRGSIARFINHSCEPNCEMIKMTVAGKPRMALFAGENGIMTGEELTYDYNFNPYSVKNVQQCRCGAPSCRGVLGPKPKEIRDALKPLTTTGKRKFQQALEDGIETVTKKRKINIPTGVKKALSNAKAQTTHTLSKARFRSSGDEEKGPLVKSASKTSLRRSKSTSIIEKSLDSSKTKTTVTYSRHRSSTALAVKEEVEEAEKDEMPISRRSSVRAATNSLRKNVVRTVKRSGRTTAAGGRRGKSIRVIEDA
ncbi:MAG: hypothetical protein Q9225_002904 [Loekoesia sp. 1 TL-2023]